MTNAKKKPPAIKPQRILEYKRVRRWTAADHRQLECSGLMFCRSPLWMHTWHTWLCATHRTDTYVSRVCGLWCDDGVSVLFTCSIRNNIKMLCKFNYRQILIIATNILVVENLNVNLLFFEGFLVALNKSVKLFWHVDEQIVLELKNFFIFKGRIKCQPSKGDNNRKLWSQKKFSFSRRKNCKRFR